MSKHYFKTDLIKNSKLKNKYILMLILQKQRKEQINTAYKLRNVYVINQKQKQDFK